VTDAGLPDGFSFEDFLGALDDLDAPGEEDLPTDHDGCVELVTTPTSEAPAALARLREAAIVPHVELPDEEDRATPGATASIFVPRGELARARRILGIAT
jgi:hypothetical protein